MGHWALGIGHPFGLPRQRLAQVAQGKWALVINYSPLLPLLPIPHSPLPTP
ncbi:hypothetical protein [Nostoc sp. CHAB 5715]|uniref:hypothetical protein n=1 Tax=Nostoc sp. CHAB 5715 TaxID=2780400 RepID=UPI001E3F712E|nr:hypothetical protein [Nostoc sp. CHAB 5715]MCC5621852.1 hypothetical protein [Nostoc sp. CHAB 5715]